MPSDRTTFGRRNVRMCAEFADNWNVNELASISDWAIGVSKEDGPSGELHLHATSARSALNLVSNLAAAVDDAGGWVLQRGMADPFALQIRIEIQGRFLMDLYAALLANGLELSRDSHRILTEQCTCAQLHREIRSVILPLCLRVGFAAEPTALWAWWGHGTA